MNDNVISKALQNKTFRIFYNEMQIQPMEDDMQCANYRIEGRP